MQTYLHHVPLRVYFGHLRVHQLDDPPDHGIEDPLDVFATGYVRATPWPYPHIMGRRIRGVLSHAVEAVLRTHFGVVRNPRNDDFVGTVCCFVSELHRGLSVK